MVERDVIAMQGRVCPKYQKATRQSSIHWRERGRERESAGNALGPREMRKKEGEGEREKKKLRVEKIQEYLARPLAGTAQLLI